MIRSKRVKISRGDITPGGACDAGVPVVLSVVRLVLSVAAPRLDLVGRRAKKRVRKMEGRVMTSTAKSGGGGRATTTRLLTVCSRCSGVPVHIRRSIILLPGLATRFTISQRSVNEWPGPTTSCLVSSGGKNESRNVEAVAHGTL